MCDRGLYALSIGFSVFIPEHQSELSNDYLTVLQGRYETNHDNGTGSLFAPQSLPCAIWAFTLIRSNGTKLSLRVEWTMRIDEPAILTSVKVFTFAKDFGIF